MLKVCTLNCQGLRDSNTRHAVFQDCLKHDICFLQETYITEVKVNAWKREWPGEFFSVNGTSNSNGLITLFNKGSNCDNFNVFYSCYRILGITATINDEPYYFINYYAPSDSNSEKIKYMNKLYHVLSLTDSNNIIIGGDFNLVLNNDLDIISGKPHDRQLVKMFNNFVNSFSLVDTWRLLHDRRKEFTWSRPRPFLARRLDYIFLHESLSSSITLTNINYCVHSDHKKVICHFSVDLFQRGKSYWKLNTSVLRNQEYINFMNSEIEIFLNEDFDDPNERLDLLKIMIKSKTILFCHKENNEMKNTHNRLLHDINVINNALIKDPLNSSLVKSLEEKKLQLEIIEKHRTKGTIIRSRIKDIDEGEKNNTYFLNLENSKSKSNTITALSENNNTLTNHLDILDKLKRHFESLSSPDINVINADVNGITQFLSGSSFPTLSTFESSSLDQELTINEIGKALSKLDNNSSPGIDGIPAEWYKVFYSKIKHLLYDSFCFSINNGNLSVLQSRGVIILTPKGKDLRKDKIKNWRPITLTNSDYKIFSKIIALRLQSILDSIININQSGFMRGRSIADHLRYIDDILNLTSTQNIDGMLISLDYEKAFDSINRDSIIAAMKIFGFGEYFIQCVKTLLYISESCVQNGGWLSSFFSTTRGVKQGCCASPLLFLIIVEIMAIRIRESENIKGLDLKINGAITPQAKILQYCDDTTLILKSIDDLVNAIDVIDSFYLVSGLKLNKEKSMGQWIGGAKNNEFFPTVISWKEKNEYLKILGVFFNPFVEASNIELNWVSKIEKAKSIVKQLEKRKVSMFGRILLCKTYVHSLFAYVLQALSLPEKVIKEIDSICFKYVWKSNSNCKKVIEKIKRSVMCLSIEDGGAKMIKIQDQQDLFLLKWIKRTAVLKSSLLNSTYLSDSYFSCFGMGEYFLEFSCSPKSIVIPKFFSRFWSDLFSCYLINKCNILQEEDSPSSIFNEGLFNNEKITYKSKMLFYQSWIKAGVRNVRHITNGVNFKSYCEISNIVGPYPNLIFEYNSIINSTLKHALAASMEDIPTGNSILIKERLLTFFKLNNQKQRKLLTGYKSTNNICGYKFWSNHLKVDILPHYISTIINLKEIKMRWLIFRIFHNIFPTNILQNKYKMKESDKCICGEKDYIDHYFVNCNLLADYWRHVKNHILSITDFSLPNSTAIRLFGIDPNDENLDLTTSQMHTINYLLVLAKSAISTAKYYKSQNYTLYFENALILRRKYLD